MTFGERIKRRREREGLNQSQLARKLGVHRQTIWGWESGRHRNGQVIRLTGLSHAVDWLLEDETTDVLEWKERALRAEYTLAQMTRSLVQYRRDRDNGVN